MQAARLAFNSLHTWRPAVVSPNQLPSPIDVRLTEERKLDDRLYEIGLLASTETAK